MRVITKIIPLEPWESMGKWDYLVEVKTKTRVSVELVSGGMQIADSVARKMIRAMGRA